MPDPTSCQAPCSKCKQVGVGRVPTAGKSEKIFRQVDGRKMRGCRGKMKVLVSVVARDHMVAHGDYHAKNPEVSSLAVEMCRLGKTSA